MIRGDVTRLVSFLKEYFHCYDCGSPFHEDQFALIGMRTHAIEVGYICPQCKHDYSCAIPEISITAVLASFGELANNDLVGAEAGLEREAVSADDVLEVRSFAKTLTDQNLSRIWPQQYLAVKALPKPITSSK